MARTFTREEFYTLVWSKPMTHLAKEFAISDVALHKICKKHDIPKPSLGWWAKKAAGKPVKQTLLPPAAKGSAAQLTISDGESRGEPAIMSEAREKARVLASSIDVEAAIEAHPIVERMIAGLRRAKPIEQTRLALVKGAGMIPADVAPASFDRLALALSRIVAATKELQIELVHSEAGAVFQCDCEKIGFRIYEIVKRERHVVTEAELAAQGAWRRKRERQRNSWNHTIDYDPLPHAADWDYHASGQLAFEFAQQHFWGASPRRAFRDAKVQRLEAMALEIAVGIAFMRQR